MTEFYSDGSITVTNGSVDFVGVATAWLPVNSKAGDTLNVDGRVMVIGELADATHGKFVVPYAGATGAGKPYAIVKTSAAWGTNRELAVQTAEMIRLLTTVSIPNTGIAINAYGTFANRGTHDAATAGFAYLSLDGLGGQDDPLIYIKASATAGDWADPVSIVGPEGPGGNHVALSDEVTIVTTGQKLQMRHFGVSVVQAIRASLNVASAAGPVTIDIKKNGVSILSTKLTIDQGETTSKTAATPYTLADPTLGDDDILTFHVDAAGAGAIGLKVLLKEATA